MSWIAIIYPPPPTWNDCGDWVKIAAMDSEIGKGRLLGGAINIKKFFIVWIIAQENAYKEKDNNKKPGIKKNIKGRKINPDKYLLYVTPWSLVFL